MTDGPLIVQSDKTLLLEVDHPGAEDARRAIAPFAELERAPEHVHTYRVTPLGLWNARAAGHDAEQVVNALLTYSRYAVPHALLIDVAETMDRYGRLTLEKDPTHGLILHTIDRPVLEEVLRHKKIQPLLGVRIDDLTVVVHPSERGHLKQELLKVGWPAEDLAGYVDGEAHPIELDTSDWSLRPYQQQAVDGFWDGGSGVVVLPCGAGKTLVGAGAMAAASATTLILVTNTVSARQWKDELLKRTSLTEERDRRVLRDAQGDPAGHHRDLPGADDEAEGRLHPPRPARRPRLGPHRLRRGPPAARADLPDDRRPAGAAPARAHRDPGPRGRPRGRRVLPHRAEALRRALEGHRGAGLHRSGRLRRGARHAPRRRADGVCDVGAGRALPARVVHRRQGPGRVEQLVERHRGEPTLVIGQYLDQLDELAERLDAPIITGETTVPERQKLFEAFRVGEIQPLVVSKVANFSIDLPEASVAIQVSGTFGSRQEEAQRLGRVLRPKGDGRTAHFYTVVARDTVDADFAAHRQRFLAEQGYAYRIVDADDL